MATSGLVLIVIYTAFYLVVRSRSFQRDAAFTGTSSGKDFIILGVSENDLHKIVSAAFSGDEDEQRASDRIEKRMETYGFVFAPLCRLDEMLTGDRLITSFEEMTNP